VNIALTRSSNIGSPGSRLGCRFTRMGFPCRTCYTSKQTTNKQWLWVTL